MTIRWFTSTSNSFIFAFIQPSRFSNTKLIYKMKMAEAEVESVMVKHAPEIAVVVNMLHANGFFPSSFLWWMESVYFGSADIFFLCFAEGRRSTVSSLLSMQTTQRCCRHRKIIIKKEVGKFSTRFAAGVVCMQYIAITERTKPFE